MNNHSKYYRFLIWLAVPAILALYYNQTANWHYHMLSNGQVVEHSHPYKKNHLPGTPFQQHHHTDVELSLLALLHNISAIAFFAVFVSSLCSQFRDKLLSSYSFLFIQQAAITFRPLRAPPA